MGLRRRSREKALQILYSKEYNQSRTLEELTDDYWRYYNLPSSCSEMTSSDAEERSFVQYLLARVTAQKATIESLIEKATINWRIDRIGLIERNILRLAVAELLDETNEIPYKATINEAIDIAKKFGNKDSSSFVNGIINKIADILEVKQRKL